jgi:hypothetical protein
LSLAVIVTLAFGVGVMAAGPIYTDAARGFILRSAFATAPPPERDVRVDLYGNASFDLAAADREVRSAARMLPVGRIITQGTATVQIGPQERSISLLYRDGQQDYLHFRTGRAPRAGEIALPSGIARLDGLKTADRVVVLGSANRRTTLRVSGLFDPPTAPDDYWFALGTTLGPQVKDVATPLPAVVAPSYGIDLARKLDLTTHYAWDLYLDGSDLHLEDALRLPAAYTAVASIIRSRVPETQGVSSEITMLIDGLQRDLTDLRVPILLVLVQIFAVTLVVLVAMGVLLASRQSFELAILHSRGFSSRSLRIAQMLQAAVAALLAWPLGVAIGLLLARFAGITNGPHPAGVPFSAGLPRSALLFGAAASAIGAVVVAVPSATIVRRTIVDERRQTSRESKPLLARAPVELIVLPVGLFATAQLRNIASPSPASAQSGTVPIDPLLLFAPTLVIVGASFLAVRLCSWGLGAFDGRIGRSRRISTYLAGRRLIRSPGVAYASAVLLVLSIGLLFVSTSYRATTLRNHADTAHASVGADWVASVAEAPSGPTAAAALAPGMSAIARFQPGALGDEDPVADVGLAVDPSTLGHASWWRADFADDPLPTLLGDLETPPVGMPLPQGARELSLALDAPPSAAGLDIQVSAARPDDSVIRTTPQPLDPGRNTYAFQLDGASRLLAVTVTASSSAHPRRLPLVFDDVTLDGSPLSFDGWVPILARGGSGRFVGQGTAWRLSARFGLGGTLVGIEPEPPELPAIVSPGVAELQGPDMQAWIGDRILRLHRVATAAWFPSIDPNDTFIVIPSPALFDLERALPGSTSGPNEVWVHGAADPSDTVRQAGFSVEGTRSALAIEVQLARTPDALAVGLDAAAAVAGLGLIVAGVMAALYFAQRRRDLEFASLRAMGATRRVLFDTVAQEQFALIGGATTMGILIGSLVLWWVSRPLLRTVSVVYPPPAVHVDVRVMVVALIVIGVTAVIAVTAATRALFRSSITGVLRGDPE